MPPPPLQHPPQLSQSRARSAPCGASRSFFTLSTALRAALPTALVSNCCCRAWACEEREAAAAVSPHPVYVPSAETWAWGAPLQLPAAAPAGPQRWAALTACTHPHASVLRRVLAAPASAQCRTPHPRICIVTAILDRRPPAAARAAGTHRAVAGTALGKRSGWRQLQKPDVLGSVSGGDSPAAGCTASVRAPNCFYFILFFRQERTLETLLCFVRTPMKPDSPAPKRRRCERIRVL